MNSQLFLIILEIFVLFLIITPSLVVDSREKGEQIVSYITNSYTNNEVYFDIGTELDLIIMLSIKLFLIIIAVGNFIFISKLLKKWKMKQNRAE